MSEEFKKILFGLFEIYDKEATADKAKIYWSTLGQYTIQSLKAAANAWVRKSQFMPKPADLIKLLGGNNKHLSADEAWALAIMASDESNTVVWTREMSQAWGLARVVYENGDHVGARRTFIQMYERLVDESILFNKPVETFVSLGFDKSKREDALNQAVFNGLLTQDKANHYLPKPENNLAMLENKNISEKSSNPIAHIANIRKMLKGGLVNAETKAN
ncbi:hypothetical protein RHO13_01875 [Orbus wheelerorum]|uniref:hypothetical protein n=1 Tax=Orbus wheelerorum TaxID=3074111 RepID=UPI00370D5DE8